MVNPLREEAPGVAADPSLRTGAGTPVFAQVTVTNHAREPRVLAVTALGVDAAWLPAPSRSQPLMPGASAQLDLPLHPAIGTMPARYPLTVAVQALDPASGAVTAPTAMTEIVLVVDAPGQVGVELAPADVTAVFGKRIAVLLRNTGPLPAEVRLDVQAPTSARIRLGSGPVLVRPGETVRVAGRARVRRVRFLGHRARHAYTVTARSTGAPRHAQGSVTERAILGPAGAKVGVIMTVIAVWLVVGALLIPKLADHVKSGQGGGPNATETAPATGAAGGPGGGGGAGGGSGAGGGGAGGGAGGAGGSASGAAKKVRLNGTVAGAAAAGVAVTLRPTSLVEKQAETATPIGIAPQTLAVHGMVQAGSVNLTAPGTVSPKRATVTSDDGAWSFPGISAPGYYLLTFARPGYQTQRYVINAAETAATEPLKVTLAAGQGTLGGTIAGPSGPVGGAQITITDGTNTITTSSNSRGNVGRWSVDGLSTPSTYLVSAGKDGLGTESRIVTLAAGGSAQADLTLHAGVASLVGTVQGVNDLGDTTGLGGVSVSATDGTVTRTATTVTDGPVGRYTLPGLPVPGRYTVTITADGYQQQTREVSLAKGASKATVSGTLTRSTAVVAGKVTVPESGDAEGAGLVLSNPNQTYKTMSGSGGTFRLNGVAPGSYVIAADLFGFTQEFVAVVAVAGRTASVNIALHSQPNGGLPSTAQIRIQGVMDATTNGPITCATAPACPLTIAVDSGTADDFDSSDMPPGGYVVPASSGLAPGLHKVIVHADGYEDVTVSAQVPVGDASTLTPTATVPTVTLFPAPKLVGTITAAVGSATGVCVVAAPSGTPTGCTEGEGIVDPDTGAYELTLPSHGTYQVSVLTPSGSEYIAVPPISMTFGLGQTLRYDATLHRLGRIDVTLLHPDATTGLLVPVPDNPDVSSAACDDPLTSTGPTLTVTDSALNQVRKVCWNGPKFAFARLQPGTYHISGQYQGHTSASQTVFVDKDQEPSTTVTVVSPLGQFVGRLVSTTGGTTHGVAGATITIGGITGYNGTDPATDQKTVTTDASGCFAITSTGTAATAVSPCGVIAVDDPARATLALATPQATLVISHDDYQPLTLTNKGIGGAGLITVTLTPKPSTFDATDCAASADGCRLRVVPASPAPDLSTANIVVAKQPAGAGRVSVVANSTGELTWDDSNLGPDNEAWPGTYTLTATLPGFAPATSTVTCPLNAHCTRHHPGLYRWHGNHVSRRLTRRHDDVRRVADPARRDRRNGQRRPRGRDPAARQRHPRRPALHGVRRHRRRGLRHRRRVERAHGRQRERRHLPGHRHGHGRRAGLGLVEGVGDRARLHEQRRVRADPRDGHRRHRTGRHARRGAGDPAGRCADVDDRDVAHRRHGDAVRLGRYPDHRHDTGHDQPPVRVRRHRADHVLAAGVRHHDRDDQPAGDARRRRLTADDLRPHRRQCQHCLRHDQRPAGLRGRGSAAVERQRLDRARGRRGVVRGGQRRRQPADDRDHRELTGRLLQHLHRPGRHVQRADLAQRVREPVAGDHGRARPGAGPAERDAVARHAQRRRRPELGERVRADRRHGVAHADGVEPASSRPAVQPDEPGRHPRLPSDVHGRAVR